MANPTETSASPYPLLDGEQVLEITEQETAHHYPNPPSSVEQLLRLTRAEHVGDIGRFGPVLAALAMHQTQAPEHLRLFEATFGRDSLQSASFLTDIYPELTHATLVKLASLQGTGYGQENEEEPGRIIHEARDDTDVKALELTAMRGWKWPYYGSVDATPLFIRTTAEYIRLHDPERHILEKTYIDRLGTEQTMRDALYRAVNWIRWRRSQNPEGLLEFKASRETDIENQVWKDSYDAYHHRDGTIANHQYGIAAIEVQVGAYEALLDAADLLGDSRYTSEAATLRETILSEFWTEEHGGYFVIGTDRDANKRLRQLTIRTSNMGHVLNSRLLEGDDSMNNTMRTKLVKQLTSPELRCEAGIRTLASNERRFRPGAYHNGSVWPWDTTYIALGLQRHGYSAEAESLMKSVLTIANVTGLFPEFVRGDQTGITLNTCSVLLWDGVANKENHVEQPPQEVQAWTVAAVRLIKHLVAEKERATRHKKTLQA